MEFNLRTNPRIDIDYGYTVVSAQGHYCVNCVSSVVPDVNEGDDCFHLCMEEVDYPCHCAVCGCLLYSALTSDGYEYLREFFDWKDTSVWHPVYAERWYWLVPEGKV